MPNIDVKFLDRDPQKPGTYTFNESAVAGASIDLSTVTNAIPLGKHIQDLTSASGLTRKHILADINKFQFNIRNILISKYENLKNPKAGSLDDYGSTGMIADGYLGGTASYLKTDCGITTGRYIPSGMENWITTDTEGNRLKGGNRPLQLDISSGWVSILGKDKNGEYSTIVERGKNSSSVAAYEKPATGTYHHIAVILNKWHKVGMEMNIGDSGAGNTPQKLVTNGDLVREKGTSGEEYGQWGKDDRKKAYIQGTNTGTFVSNDFRLTDIDLAAHVVGTSFTPYDFSVVSENLVVKVDGGANQTLALTAKITDVDSAVAHINSSGVGLVGATAVKVTVGGTDQLKIRTNSKLLVRYAVGGTAAFEIVAGGSGVNAKKLFTASGVPPALVAAQTRATKTHLVGGSFSGNDFGNSAGTNEDLKISVDGTMYTLLLTGNASTVTDAVTRITAAATAATTGGVAAPAPITVSEDSGTIKIQSTGKYGTAGSISVNTTPSGGSGTNAIALFTSGASHPVVVVAGLNEGLGGGTFTIEYVKADATIGSADLTLDAICSTKAKMVSELNRQIGNIPGIGSATLRVKAYDDTTSFTPAIPTGSIRIMNTLSGKYLGKDYVKLTGLGGTSLPAKVKNSLGGAIAFTEIKNDGEIWGSHTLEFKKYSDAKMEVPQYIRYKYRIGQRIVKVNEKIGTGQGLTMANNHFSNRNFNGEERIKIDMAGTTGTNTFNFSPGDNLIVGDCVIFMDSFKGAPGATNSIPNNSGGKIKHGGTYFVVDATSGAIKLSENKGGTPITITAGKGGSTAPKDYLVKFSGFRKELETYPTGSKDIGCMFLGREKFNWYLTNGVTVAGGLNFLKEHKIPKGTAVQYTDNEGAIIPELTSGQEYFVVGSRSDGTTADKAKHVLLSLTRNGDPIKIKNGQGGTGNKIRVTRPFAYDEVHWLRESDEAGTILGNAEHNSSDKLVNMSYEPIVLVKKLNPPLKITKDTKDINLTWKMGGAGRLNLWKQSLNTWNTGGRGTAGELDGPTALKGNYGHDSGGVLLNIDELNFSVKAVQ